MSTRVSHQNLEYSSCPICCSSINKEAYGKFHPYKVVKCQSCSFYFLSPRLTESSMLDLYSDDTYFEGGSDGYSSYSEQKIALCATFKKLMSNIDKHKLSGGRLLEVGCGYGYFLKEAAGKFETRVGTDFSAYAAQQASNYADRVYHGGIEQVPSSEKFDLIVSTHVIEHVYHPRDFIDKLLQHLHPGSAIIIATPDMGSFWRYLMGHKWTSFKLPEHVLYFDSASLSSLMRQVGLQNIKRIPYPHAFPLPLVASKLGLEIPPSLNRLNLWIPATTLALYGRYYG